MIGESNMKNLLSVFIVLMLVFSVSLNVGAETVITVNNWAVEAINSDKEYMIDSCSSDSATITIPETLNNIPVTAVNDGAFMLKGTLQTLTVKAPLKSIGEYAFLNCTALKKVTLPSTLTEIGEGVFSGTEALKTINLEETTVAAIPGYAFSGSGIEKISLPDNCSTVADNAFLNCAQLKSVSIPLSVTSIGESAFAGCQDITIVCDKGSYADEYADSHSMDRRYNVYGSHIGGDADGDGYVTILDATKVQRVLADFDEEDVDAVRIRGDVDGNGLDIFDATSIQRFLADMDNPYDIGETADEYYPLPKQE